MAKQKFVLGLSMADAKQRTKALRCAANFPGVVSVSIGGDKLMVEGEGIDPVVMTMSLRKKVGSTQIDKVETIEEKEKEKKKEKEGETNTMANYTIVPPAVIPYYVGTHQPAYYYTSENADQNYENFCSIM